MMEKNILKILFNIVIACVMIIVMFNIVSQIDVTTQNQLIETTTTINFTDLILQAGIFLYFIIGLFYSILTTRMCIITPSLFIELFMKMPLWPIFIFIDYKNEKHIK